MFFSWNHCPPIPCVCGRAASVVDNDHCRWRHGYGRYNAFIANRSAEIIDYYAKGIKRVRSSCFCIVYKRDKVFGKAKTKLAMYACYAPPHRAEAFSDDARLTSVCLSRTSGLSQERRDLGRLKLAQGSPRHT